MSCLSETKQHVNSKTTLQKYGVAAPPFKVYLSKMLDEHCTDLGTVFHVSTVTLINNSKAN